MENIMIDLSTPETRDWMMGVLHQHKVRVTFTKVDGTDRVMNCTLREDLIPALNVEQIEKAVKRTVNENIARVWDLDKESWRSFRLDSIKEFNFSIE